MNLSCNVSTGTISRSGNVWIGYECSYNGTSHCTNLTGDNITTHTLTSDNCPYDYCKQNTIVFNSSQVDHQCKNHRSGILCGSCANGYSITLGSNKCKKCTDDGYIALVVVFAVAGIALVVLLIALNLTVSVGTINGLIFFANIVRLRDQIFFYDKPILVLHQFLSWLNLDLGIETCFYSGMTPYAKMWLQFAFPLYIWALMYIIIIVCRYSTKAARLVRHNAVPVLATLLLMSYMKIVHCLMLSFSPRDVKHDGDTKQVWSVDGNLPYAQDKHLILLIVAVLVSVLLVTPYTLFLLFLPAMERMCPFCSRLWLQFLKPLCDAYSGPYKDKYRFWTGLLIVVRIMVAAATIFLNAVAIRYIIMLTAIFLLMFTFTLNGTYKKRAFNVLESSFFVILLCMSILSLFGSSLTSGPGDVTAAASPIVTTGMTICLSLSLLLFVIIVVGHVMARLCPDRLQLLNERAAKVWRKITRKRRGKRTDGPRSTYVINTIVETSAKRRKCDYRDSILQLQDEEEESD